jgi:hypothetical protein
MRKIGELLTGRRFGRLVVVDETRPGRKHPKLLCRCDCGNVTSISALKLRGGITQSCGCLRLELQRTRQKHGYCSGGKVSPEYLAHRGALDRCHRPKCNAYRNYGARGISVCDRWRFGADGLTGFQCFIRDVGNRPTPDHSLERNDVNGNYEPGNVRWATRLEQARNKQDTVFVNVADTEFALSEAVLKFSTVSYSSVRCRLLRGWHPEAAVLTPARQRLEAVNVPF